MDFIQILGFLGVGLNLLIYQQRTRKRVLVNKIIANGVWAVHYFLLGAFSATGIALIGMLSTGVFVKVNPKSRAGKIWLGVFILMNIISGIVTWNTALTLLTVAASIISNISFFVGVPKYTRRFALIISACMGTYGYMNGSIASVINEILTVTSAISGIIRIDLKKEKI